MIIEILDNQENVIAKLSGVINPEQEFQDNYKEMYNASSWRIVGQQLPNLMTEQQKSIVKLNKEYRGKFRANNEYYINALRKNDIQLIETINKERDELQQIYSLKLEAIRNE